MKMFGAASKVWIVVAAATLLVLAGCGEEAESENQDQNQDENNETDQNNDELELCNDADVEAFDSDYELRFNTFAFAEGSPGAELNDLIEDFLDQSMDYPIIVLLELTELDAEAGDVTVRGGAGLHAEGDGEYRWDDELEEPDETAGSFDEDGNLEAHLPLFHFVATVQTDEGLLKTVIPIRDIELTATVRADEDGSNPCIDDGHLEGFVVQEDIEDVRIALTPGASGLPLETVLDTDEMNADHSGDGEIDAWEMEAYFEAEQTVIVD